MGVVRVFLWLVYEANKYAMNLYWLVWINFWYTGRLEWFAHFIGVVSLIVMISNLVYMLSGSEI